VGGASLGLARAFSCPPPFGFMTFRPPISRERSDHEGPAFSLEESAGGGGGGGGSRKKKGSWACLGPIP